MEETSDTGKRRRQAYYTKGDGGHLKRRRRFELRQNGRGVLVTAGGANHTREAIREAMVVIKEELDRKPTSSEPSVICSELSEVLDTELAQLKEDSERIIPVKDLTKGVNFLQFSSQTDCPNEVVYRVLNRVSPLNPLVKEHNLSSEENRTEEDPSAETVVEKKCGDLERMRISCRFMSRLIPIEITCPPHLENFKVAIRLLIKAYFPESELVLHPEKFQENEENIRSIDESREKQTTSKESEQDIRENGIDAREEGTEADMVTAAAILKTLKPAFTVPKNSTWAVQFERRAGMKTLDRDVVTQEIARMVGNNYTVNLGRPGYSVIVEVFCGMSVVREFGRLLKYNIHRLCHPEVQQQNIETDKDQKKSC